MVAFVLIALFAASLSPLGKQAAYLWKQHQIGSQVLPPDTVIFTEDPARIALLRGRPDYNDYREARKQSSGQNPTNFPNTWVRVTQRSSFPAPLAVATGEMGNVQIEDTFGYPRKSSGGTSWIVHLDQVHSFATSDGQRRVCLTQSTFKPAGWKPGAKAIWMTFSSEDVLLKQSDVFTLFAPQPDPDDTSRITMPYELNGQRGVLKAAVTDQGRVHFRVHSGPAEIGW